MKNLIYIIILLFFTSSCGNKKQEKTQADDPQAIAPIQPNEVYTEQDSIRAVGEQILMALKDADYTELIKYFSEKGVRFSPYANIDLKTAKVFSPDEFILATQNNQSFIWGHFDGTGKQIKLNIPDYFKRFVYSADFLNAEAVGYDAVIKQGNSINNIKEVYPNHHYVDYHFSGFNQEAEGMDWTSLRLVFEKIDNEFYLVAIVHDQWTI